MSPIPILVVLLMASAATAGWFVRGWHEDSVRLDAEVSARKHELRQAENHAAKQADLDAGRRKTTKEIDDVAKTDGGADVCFGADELRILRDAIKAPGAAVSPSSGADGRNGDGNLEVGDDGYLRLPGLRRPLRALKRPLTS